METSAQQLSWMVSFGLSRIDCQKAAEYDLTRKQGIIQKLKTDIAEKIDSGISGRVNIYNALLQEDKIPLCDGTPMSIKAFGRHVQSVCMFKERRGSQHPKGEKAKKIVDLFDSGVTEDELIKISGLSASYVYVTLVKYERISKRDHSNSKRHDSLKIFMVDKLLMDGFSDKEISIKTGASKKYVKHLKMLRKKTIDLLNKGKSANEVCMSLKISKVHAEYLEREAKLHGSTSAGFV